MNTQNGQEKRAEDRETKLLRYKFWATMIVGGLNEVTVSAFLKSEGFDTITDFANRIIELESECRI